jgi:hypothetical protein
MKLPHLMKLSMNVSNWPISAVSNWLTTCGVGDNKKPMGPNQEAKSGSATDTFLVYRIFYMPNTFCMLNGFEFHNTFGTIRVM